MLCPVNDTSFRPDDAARRDGLRRSLSELMPILEAQGVLGLVEPLGFPESSLRLKAEAVDAIQAIAGGRVFRLVHDTFHHTVAAETEVFPHRTGLVHISGVEDAAVPVSSLRDPHRVLVGPGDRLGNAGQIRRLLGGRYTGYLSFEPFAESVHALADIKSALAQSMAHLEAQQIRKAA